MEPLILVLGYRSELLKVLEKRGYRYIIWAEKKYKLKKAHPEKYIVAPFPTDPEKIQGILDKHKLKKASHVIASTESSVFCAYHARRLLGARINAKAVAQRCTDKLAMKTYLSQHKIPMTQFFGITKDMDIEKVFRQLKSPIVVKDRKNSGGRGTIITDDKKIVLDNLKNYRMLEKFVDAPEASIESFIQNKEIIFTNVTYYFRKGQVNVVPAPFKSAEIKAIQELNKKVVQALKINWGITHLEVYRSKDGILFGEVALRPPGGYIMRIISLAYGFNAWEAFLDIELGLVPKVKDRVKCHAAAILVHPGMGVVKKIKGWKKVSSMKCVVEAKLKIKEGFSLQSKSSVSDEVAHFIVKTKTSKKLKESILKIRKELILVIKRSKKTSS